ncbi:MAG: MBL fold metallo-hydrolase [Candidatus Sumerlaeaceae bacterium]|nr:MBL fold metallo-hydrolase [Candidatus Sumerlaeaceae bacterium]
MTGWVFHFLSSGSAGNCTLVEDGDERFLIDFGLPAKHLISCLDMTGTVIRPRTRQARRADEVGPSRLVAALVTHLHGDHVSDTSLRLLCDNRVRLHLHAEHLEELRRKNSFRDSLGRGLTACYVTNREFQVTGRTWVLPLKMSHDAPRTHGFVFRLDGDRGPGLKAGYVADTGCFRAEWARQLADCDLLALEFNHDEQMEIGCGRPQHLKDRVLSDQGHLSNAQAAEALDRILSCSSSRLPRWVVMLHLSKDCNRPQLAQAAARPVLERHGCKAKIVVTRRRQAVPGIHVVPAGGSVGPAVLHRRLGGVQLSLFDTE